MKKKTVILLAVLILAAVCLFNSVYTVEENEYGCTVRLSKIISTTDEPGLHFKVPFLDSVKSFPKATMLYDIPPSEVLTADKQNMTVDCYILWRISGRHLPWPGKPDLTILTWTLSWACPGRQRMT